MNPPAEDREREPFRWCVYCDADCETDEPEHGPSCPSSTGIYPVEVHKHCETCSCDGSFLCSSCDTELQVGDFYMHREIEPGDPLLPGAAGAAVYEVICMGCKAHDELGSAD
jgi:hypothetical protein